LRPPRAAHPHSLTSHCSLLHPPPPRSTLFPYTTLFRSLLNVIEPVQQVGNGGLAGAGGTNKSDLLTGVGIEGDVLQDGLVGVVADRKSTRLNSSHVSISYAVFCLKKKNPVQTADAAPCD